MYESFPLLNDIAICSYKNTKKIKAGAGVEDNLYLCIILRVTSYPAMAEASKTVNNAHENEPIETLEPAVYLFPVNLSDGPVTDVLPERNLRLIRQIKFFAVENLRTARRFLKKVDRSIDVNGIEFVELSEHTPESEVSEMLRPVRNGKSLGIMSEAGCPAVADPGALLVEVAQRAGIRVVPLVGPSSILMSLMGSGMNGQMFTFNGYLPIADDARAACLREMVSSITRRGCTQLFIETPYRNNKLIETLIRHVPARLKLCIASDITGPAESVVTRTIADWEKVKYDYNKIPAIFVLGK